MTTPIETLRLSPRPYNALCRAGINTVEELLAHRHLPGIAGLGKLGVAEINAAVEKSRAQADNPQPPTAADTPADLPFPEFTDYPTNDPDGRSLHRYLANTMAAALAQRPDHPNKEEIKKLMAEHIRVGTMTDDQFRGHELYEANPVNRLTQDEKLHCIRTLPITIVQKLFPYL